MTLSLELYAIVLDNFSPHRSTKTDTPSLTGPRLRLRLRKVVKRAAVIKRAKAA